MGQQPWNPLRACQKLWIVDLTQEPFQNPHLLWPPHAKSWLIGKDFDAGRDWGQGGEGDDRGWDGWMASLTRWTWVWVNSGSWWWTGRPGVLRYMGSQRVGHDWATELNWRYWTAFEDQEFLIDCIFSRLALKGMWLSIADVIYHILITCSLQCDKEKANGKGLTIQLKMPKAYNFWCIPDQCRTKYVLELWVKYGGRDINKWLRW